MPDYGGSPGDHAWYGGRLAPGAKLEVWNDAQRTSRITNVVDAATGQPFAEGVIVCDDLGRYLFDLPDAAAESVYICPVGSSNTYRIDRADLGGRVSVLENTQASLSSTVAEMGEQVDTNTTAAATARQIADGLAASKGEPEGIAPLDESGRVPQVYLRSGGGGVGWLNVMEYQAEADGATDDTAAVQAALDAARAAGGGVVYMPGGVYPITGVLRIYGHTTLKLAPHATIRRDAATTMLLNGDADQDFGGYSGHGSIVIEGGTWDANGTVITPNNMVLSIGHAEGVTIRDTTILDVPGFHAIELNSTLTGRIENVRCLGFIDPGGREFSEAIQIDGAYRGSVFGGFGPYDHTPSRDVEVRGCYIGPSATPGASSWGRGIGSHSTAPDAPHRSIRILGNTIEDVAEYGVGAYCWSESTIADNTLRSTGAGIWVRSLDSSKGADQQNEDGTSIAGSQPLETVTIADNIIVGTGPVNEAILVEGEVDGPVEAVSVSGNTLRGISVGGAENGIRMVHVHDSDITGNVMREVAGTGISTESCDGLAVSGNRLRDVNGAGITFIDCDTSCNATGNTLRAIGEHGLWAQGGKDITFASNTVHGIGLAVAGSYGVRVTSGASGITVSGNRLTTGGGTSGSISVTSTCTLSHVFGNDCRNSGPVANDAVNASNSAGNLA